MLAGHRREITAMFCDLRNFTVFSETAEPEEVLGFLREYHAAMGALIVAHEGTLEHFAGDGFMTFFNDPVLQPDHAARAIGLAVAMRERFAEIARSGDGAATSSRSGSASRPGTRRWGGSASRAATTTGRSATRSSSPRGSAARPAPARSS